MTRKQEAISKCVLKYRDALSSNWNQPYGVAGIKVPCDKAWYISPHKDGFDIIEEAFKRLIDTAWRHMVQCKNGCKNEI